MKQKRDPKNININQDVTEKKSELVSIERSENDLIFISNHSRDNRFTSVYFCLHELSFT